MKRIPISDLRPGMDILCQCCRLNYRTPARHCKGCVCRIQQDDRPSALTPMLAKVFIDIDTPRRNRNLCRSIWDSPSFERIFLLTKEELVAYLL